MTVFEARWIANHIDHPDHTDLCRARAFHKLHNNYRIMGNPKDKAMAQKLWDYAGRA